MNPKFFNAYRYQAPPLGLKPRWLVAEERINDIIAAMERYSKAGKQIPIEWIDELGDLTRFIATFRNGESK